MSKIDTNPTTEPGFSDEEKKNINEEQIQQDIVYVLRELERENSGRDRLIARGLQDVASMIESDLRLSMGSENYGELAVKAKELIKLAEERGWAALDNRDKSRGLK